MNVLISIILKSTELTQYTLSSVHYHYIDCAASEYLVQALLIVSDIHGVTFYLCCQTGIATPSPRTLVGLTSSVLNS